MIQINENYIFKLILILLLPISLFSQSNRTFPEQNIKYKKYSYQIVDYNVCENPYLLNTDFYFESAFPLMIYSGIYYYNFNNRLWNENFRIKYRRNLYNMSNFRVEDLGVFDNYNIIR